MTTITPTPLLKAVAAATIVTVLSYFLQLPNIYMPTGSILLILIMATAILSEQKGGEQIIINLLFTRNNRQPTTIQEEEEQQQQTDNPTTDNKTDTPIYTTTPTTEQKPEIKIKYYTRTQIEQACGISTKSSQISQWKKLVDDEWKTGSNFIAQPYDYNGPNGELQFTNEALLRIAPTLSPKNKEKINQLIK